MLCDVILHEREPALTLVRTEALLAFFETPTQTMMQRAYFQNLLATWFLLSIYTLDPVALDGVQRLTNGQALYLDTNVVYSLLRLNGPERYLFVQRILRRSARLGYQVCVTPWTIAEMQESVWLARGRLARERPSPHALAQLGIESDEEFRKGYRKLERDSGVDLDDFNSLPRHIERLLEDEGVIVVDDGCREIDAATDLFDDLISKLERHRKGPEKPRALQEHDVKHLLLMRLRRGGKRRRFSNVGCVLLSNHNGLCRCAETIREHAGDPPYAVSLARWAHVTRSLIPRTSNYDQTLALMHKTPAVRPSRFISQSEIAAAQERINDHQRKPEGSALEMILDSAFGWTPEPDDYMRTNGARSGGDPRHDMPGRAMIVELEGQVRELAKQLTHERHRHEVEQHKHIHQEDARREALGLERHNRIDADRKNERLQEHVNKLHEELTQLRSQNAAASALRRQVSPLEADVRRLEAARERQVRLERGLAGALAALAGLLVTIVPWATGLISGTLQVGLDACGAAWLLAIAVQLISSSGALRVRRALIDALASTATTIIEADGSAQKTQAPAASQTRSGRSAGSRKTQGPQETRRQHAASTDSAR
jgi:hypothetical protein